MSDPTRLPVHWSGKLIDGVKIVILLCILLCLLSNIPMPMRASRKAQEATLKANLFQLRRAIDQFHADTGIYPNALADIVVPSTENTQVGSTTVKAGTYHGPYLTPSGGIEGTGMLMNPFGPLGASASIDTHWHYTSSNGKVRSAVMGTTIDGEPFNRM